MANKNNEYVVSLKADVKGLKEDIKSELKSVLREVDNVGDAISNGLAPDTKEFESKIASLESKMEKLAQNSKDVEQQVSSMKTAFKGFTELEASMRAIGEQNKEMYETFVKMTPYMREFAKTFTVMKPEQAGAAFESVMKNANTSGQAAAQTFKDMQNAAGQVGKTVKKSFYEVETAGTGIFDELNQEINTSANSLGEVNKIVNILYKSLHRLQSVNMGDKSIYSYGRETDINTNEGQGYLVKDIEDEYKRFTTAREKMKGEIGLTEEYFLQEKKTIESLLKLYEMTDFLQKENYNKIGNYSQIEKEIGTIDNLIKQYEQDILEFQTKFAQKVELKPLKIKINISDDGKLLEEINKQIDAISKNPGLKKIQIPLDFIDVQDEQPVKNKPKKTKKVKTTKSDGNNENVEIDSRLTSVAKEIKSLQDSFDKIKTPLLNDIKEWRHNLEEYLTIQFKWKKVSEEGDEEGISALFNDINHYAEKHPIWLNPDTNKLISEIENDLAKHQFKLDLSGSGLKLSGNVSGAVPVAIVGGRNTYQNPTVQRTIKQGVSSTSTATTKSEAKKDTSSVDKNSKAVEKNSDVISDVINEFKTYSQKTNETIARANKTIERLTAQNEKLDKNKPEDAEKIAENQRLIKKAQEKKDTAQSRMSALSSVTGIDIQNINNIDNDTLVATITSLVQDRNEIVDVISTTKIGGASNSKNFLTKAIRDIVDSIKAAQEALGIEVKDADTVSKEIAAKDYLKDAEQLTHMGMALKTANREIRNNIVPTEKSLQQVVDVFGGRGLTSVTQSAQNLKNVLEQYHDVFESDGGYQEYITRLNDEITQLQSEIDELSKHPRKNKTVIAEKKGQLGVKQFELEDIQSNVEPVLNIFKESIKGLPGQIAELLKGYKFIVEFIDADGKKVIESFNDKSARAPRDTEAYYKQSAKMHDRINAGEIVSITPMSTPNDSVFSILYGDKISKSTAIQQIIDAYDKLDKKAKLFVNSLIDIKKLTNENLSVSEKWALVENSGIVDRNNKGQAGRSVNVNKAIGVEDLVTFSKQIRSNKSKIQNLDPVKDKEKVADLTKENQSLVKNIANIKAANREIDSFIDTVVSSYFGVNSNAKLKAGQQKMLMRGTTISYGSSKNATVIHPEERKYQYNVSNRSYRTVPDYKPKSIDELDAELEENKKKVEQVNDDLASYRTSLNQLEELHKQEYEQKLATLRTEGKIYSPEKLQSMRKMYPEVKSYGDFVSKHNSLQSETSSLQDSITFVQNETSREKTNLSSLEAEVKSKNNQITELEEYITAIQKKGIAEYIRTLDKRIENAKSFEERIILKEKKEMALGDQNHTVLKNGEVVKETKKELVARRTEQLETLKASRDEDLGKISRSKDQIAQNERMVESLSKDLEEGMQKLQELRVAFSDMYSQYLQTWIDNVDGQITSLEKIVHSGKASDEQKKELFQAKEKKKNLSARKSEFEQSLSVEIETGYEGEVSRLETNIQRAEQELDGLEAEKANIETRIANLKNGTIVSPETPTKAGSEEAKTLALREINAIEEDLQLADKKIAAAEQKSKDYEDSIKTLKRKKENASEVRKSQKQATDLAYQDAKDSKGYKDFQEETYQQFKNQSITWDQYLEKTQAKADELVAKLKEANPSKYTGKSYTELIDILSKQKEIYDNQIKQENAYKQQLQSYRQEAMAFGRITEEELANQHAITEEKKEQVQATQQEKIVQTEQTAESRVQEQSNQIDTIRVQDLDNKMSAIDEEIAQLRNEIKSTPKQKKSVTSTKKLTNKQQAKVDEQFLGYVSQIKAKEISKNVNVKDIDLSEAINMQKQLNALAEQGNQNTEEYLILQRQLSELISKRTNQLKGTGRNGYATSTEKYDWIKTNVSKEVADFYSSGQYVAQAGKFDTAVASRLGNSLVEGFSNEFKAQCVEAAKQAVTQTKAQGGTTKEAKKAAMSVVQKLLDSVGQGIMEGIKEETTDSSFDVASKKARIKELTAQKKQYQKEKEQLVTSAQSSTTTPLPVDEVALQAGTVIVGGGSGGSGPWALEVTLQKTNEILNSISSKIDSVKNNNSNSNDSSNEPKKKSAKKTSNETSEQREKKISDVRTQLENSADDIIKNAYGEGIKSARTFNEQTLKLIDTINMEDGRVIKLTTSIDKLTGGTKTAYSETQNFSNIAKKAYAELGKYDQSTRDLFGNSNLNFPVDKIKQYNDAQNQLKDTIKAVQQSGGITTQENAQKVEEATNKVKKLREEIQKMVDNSEKLSRKGDLVTTLQENQINDVKKAMENAAREKFNGDIFDVNFEDSIDGLTTKMTFMANTGRKEVSEVTYEFDKLGNKIYQTGVKVNKTKGLFTNFFGDLKNKITELIRYYAGMNVIQQSIMYIRQGITYVREIDSALTELKKVTSETEQSYNNFLQTMSKTAATIGTTVKDLTSSAADGLIS